MRVQFPVAARRVRGQIPGQRPGKTLMFGVRRRQRHPGQRLEHALAHLARRLAGERHRDDVLGLVDRREQPQIALDQQLGAWMMNERVGSSAAARASRSAARNAVDSGVALIVPGPSVQRRRRRRRRLLLCDRDRQTQGVH